MNTDSLLPINHLLPRAVVQPPPNGWPATLDFTVRYADGRAGPPDEQMPLPKPGWIRVTDPIELTVPEIMRAIWDGAVRVEARTIGEQEVGGVVHRAVAEFTPTLVVRLGDLKIEGGLWGKLLDRPQTTRAGGPDAAAETLGVSRDTLDRMRREQLDNGWDLPGDPIVGGTGLRRRRERWDLQQVRQWAAAFQARKAEAHVRPKTGKTKSKPRRTSARPDKTGGGSLYARARRKVEQET